MDYTPNSQESAARAEYAAWDRISRIRAAIIYGCMALCVLFLIGWFVNGRPMNAQQMQQQPAFYMPDPTPIIVETQHIEIFSRNCLGYCPGQ